MFKQFNKIALITSSLLLAISVTSQSEIGIDSTSDEVIISSEENNTMRTSSVESYNLLTAGVSSVLYNQSIVTELTASVEVRDIPLVQSPQYNNDDVKIKEEQEWGADLVTIEFSDAIPNLDEDEQKEQMLIDLTEPNILDGTEGNEVCDSSKKTYMGYDAVTSVTSRQWSILNDEEYAWSDTETGFRMFGDRICIAIGQRYALPGDKVDVVMKNGSIIKCIVGDAKAKLDTDETMSYQKYDGSVIEMIVDYTYFHGVSQYPKELDGAIEKIVTLPKDF